jgi:hypothetical protein
VFFVVVVEGVYIQQGRKRTSEHHPRGKGGGEPPRLIIIEAIRIAFVVLLPRLLVLLPSRLPVLLLPRLLVPLLPRLLVLLLPRLLVLLLPRLLVLLLPRLLVLLLPRLATGSTTPPATSATALPRLLVLLLPPKRCLCMYACACSLAGVCCRCSFFAYYISRGHAEERGRGGLCD